MVVRPGMSYSAAYHKRPSRIGQTSVFSQSSSTAVDVSCVDSQRYATANVPNTTKTLCPMNNTHLLQPQSTLKSMVVAACVFASRLSLEC
ncbi:hypothetical protein M405DRAFT_218661 [Rhizopogon salebrosus TDB-379]|nr:hypothetical protein M405DRAFT_218661 [Rhizopogon salebrosus TDB-379]